MIKYVNVMESCVKVIKRNGMLWECNDKVWKGYEIFWKSYQKLW